MQDIKRLRDEIAVDPASMGYSGLTDDAVCTAMNAANRPAPIASVQIRRQLLIMGVWAEIKDNATLETSLTRRAGIRMVDTLDAFDQFSLPSPVLQAALDGCVSAGFMTTTQRAEILDLAVNQRSRADELGLPKVRPGHVADARA